MTILIRLVGVTYPQHFKCHYLHLQEGRDMSTNILTFYIKVGNLGPYIRTKTLETDKTKTDTGVGSDHLKTTE